MDAYYNNKIKFVIEEHMGKSALISQHFHSIYEIYYLLEGEIEYFIYDKIYTIKAGDIVIIPPNTLHKTVNSNSAKRKRLLIYLDRSYLSEYSDDELLLWDSVSIVRTDSLERTNRIFDELLAEYQNGKDVVLMKALLCELIILLKRKTERKNYIIESTASSRRISEVITYLNESFNTKITLESVANHFYMNPSYLSRSFKKHTGISFSDYLLKYRIKKALAEMMDSTTNITQIAFDVGFNSTNHFCKAFKKVMKISPLQYKKTILLKSKIKNDFVLKRSYFE